MDLRLQLSRILINQGWVEEEHPQCRSFVFEKQEGLYKVLIDREADQVICSFPGTENAITVTSGQIIVWLSAMYARGRRGHTEARGDSSKPGKAGKTVLTKPNKYAKVGTMNAVRVRKVAYSQGNYPKTHICPNNHTWEEDLDRGIDDWCPTCGRRDYSEIISSFRSRQPTSPVPAAPITSPPVSSGRPILIEISPQSWGVAKQVRGQFKLISKVFMGPQAKEMAERFLRDLADD